MGLRAGQEEKPGEGGELKIPMSPWRYPAERGRDGAPKSSQASSCDHCLGLSMLITEAGLFLTKVSGGLSMIKK